MLHGDRQVLVTGLGVISPIGLTVSNMWEALVSGHSGIDYISSFDPTPFRTRIAAEVRGFNPSIYVTQKQARHMDRFTQFAVAASLQAMEAAQLTIKADNDKETGVIVGNSVCGLLSVVKQLKVLNEMGPRRVSPVLATTMIGDAASVQVSLILGAHAVGIGRPILYGLAVNGEEGVKSVIREIAEELKRAMIMTGIEEPASAHKGIILFN